MSKRMHSNVRNAWQDWDGKASFDDGSADEGKGLGSGSAATAETCGECGGDVVATGGVERVCAECGLIVREERVDRGAEWRAFTAEERETRSRVGAPITHTRHDKGLGAGISWASRDASGRPLSATERYRLTRMCRRQREADTMNPGEETIRYGVSEVRRLCSQLHLPEHVNERAAVLFHRATREGLVANYSVEGVATALVYIVSRDGDRNVAGDGDRNVAGDGDRNVAGDGDRNVAGDNVGRARPTIRRLSEFEEYARVERTRWYGLVDHLESSLDLARDQVRPHHYLERVAVELGAEPLVEQRARDLLATLDGTDYSGRDPIYVVAAAFYAAGRTTDLGDNLTQVDIAATLDLNNATISTVYNALLADVVEAEA